MHDQLASMASGHSQQMDMEVLYPGFGGVPLSEAAHATVLEGSGTSSVSRIYAAEGMDLSK